MISRTTAAILAGGLGTRLSSVVRDRPKVLAPVAGRPYLAFLFDQLDAASVRTAIVCTGHLGEQVEAAFGANYRGMRLRYSREEAPLGTGGALRHAAPLLESENVLVLNGDSFCAVDLDAFVRQHAESRATASMVVVNVPDASRYGSVRVGRDGLVARFDEKSSRAQPGLINAGIYCITRDLVETIPTGRPVSLEREVFPALCPDGIHAFRSAGPFLDIGTPESFAHAQVELSRYLVPSGT